MIREIVTDKTELALVSKPVSDSELATCIITDLIDTAEHYAAKPVGCLGLAANQIGYLLRIILVWTGAEFVPMVNPVFKPRDGAMANQHEECLSRPSVRVKVKRHKRITVEWTSTTGEARKQKFSHFTARVIAHECDHLNGKFI